MPGKRPHVPTALHSEISEYSSLLRALRTSHNLDLASQLTASSSAGPSRSYVTEDNEGESEQPATESVSVSVDGSHVSSTRSKSKARSTRKAKKKDNWTRWPLLAGDVHVPEWGLEDEVELLALQALHLERDLCYDEDSVDLPLPFVPEDAPSPMVDASSDVSGELPQPYRSSVDNAEDSPDLEKLLTPQYLAALTSSASQYLSIILALLAVYVPPSEKSMQNRIHPVDWQNVLDIITVNGLADQETIDRIQRRLIALYPTSQPTRSHNFVDDEPLRAACAAHDLSFLNIDGYSAEHFAPRRKRGPYKKRKTRSTVELEYNQGSPEPSRKRSKHISS